MDALYSIKPGELSSRWAEIESDVSDVSSSFCFSNTMQAVKVSKEQNNLTKYFFSDYKRRCVGGDTEWV